MSESAPSPRADQRWPAKICRPAAPLSALPRERLFRQLDKGRACPVVWVSGPAGCGKTTLVSSYIEARNVPCLWYRVDEGDADLPTFFHYLKLAAQQLNPKRRKRLPHLTSEYLQGIPEFSRNFFSELFAGMPSGALLVFDGLQTVPESAPLHSALLDGLDRMPEGLCLTSRIARELTGYAAADRLPSTLHRRNHFTEKRQGDEAEYQYHPLFQAFLNDRARECLSGEESAAIQRRAAALAV